MESSELSKMISDLKQNGCNFEDKGFREGLEKIINEIFSHFPSVKSLKTRVVETDEEYGMLRVDKINLETLPTSGAKEKMAGFLFSAGLKEEEYSLFKKRITHLELSFHYSLEFLFLLSEVLNNFKR